MVSLMTLQTFASSPINRKDCTLPPSSRFPRNLLSLKSSFSGDAFDPASPFTKFRPLTSYIPYAKPVRDFKAVVYAKTSQVGSGNNAKSTRSQRATLDYSQILKYPIVTEAGIKNILQNNTLVFAVDKRADKKIIKDAAMKIFKVQIKKVNTSITPDGTKKAFLMLTSDHKAADVAKKVKAI
ncbi:unnamed protein product [Cuscuta europaea]|uniref:Uncharacterized protein n=1 Tax=Cuscuta europaea TaxID=41803 RepID=A0A9P0ZKP1_CUSEU|nr:unnamed protein product [Cuscuta europaea]